MDRSAFNAAAAINAQRITRQATTNELANVNTIGFKRSYEAALQTVKATGSGLETRYQPEPIDTDAIQLAPGVRIVTGNPLDVSMNNDTVMGVQGSDGRQAFTRRGDMGVSNTGVLQVTGGHPVLGQNGNPITVPPGFNISLTADGSVYAQDPQAAANVPATLVDRIQLRDASKTQLVRRVDGLFEPKGGGDITNGVDLPSVTTGSLEGSNVSPIGAMIKMMEQSRSFEQQVKVIESAKTNDESSTSMLKLS
jgi:flagellar basal-body rod protein FlgF